jgi:hypothetical protein
MLSNAPPPPRPLKPKEIREYLEFNAETIRQRRDDLIHVLQETAATHQTIDDADIAAQVGENMRMAAALSRAVEDRRKEDKRPFLSGGRVIDDWYKALIDPLVEAMRPVQARLDGWGRRQLEVARERAREAAAEKRADADRLASEAGRAISAGLDAGELLTQASEAAGQVEQAERLANGTAANLTRTRGIFGAVLSVREKWTYRVTDISQVPREYLMVNPEAVKKAMKRRDSMGRPTKEIPGIRWESQQEVGIR